MIPSNGATGWTSARHQTAKVGNCETDDKSTFQKLMPIQINQPPRSGVGFGYGFSVRTKMTEWDPAQRLENLDGVELLVPTIGAP